MLAISIAPSGLPGASAATDRSSIAFIATRATPIENAWVQKPAAFRGGADASHAMSTAGTPAEADGALASPYTRRLGRHGAATPGPEFLNDQCGDESHARNRQTEVFWNAQLQCCREAKQ